jgi:hypothetical protein
MRKPGNTEVCRWDVVLPGVLRGLCPGAPSRSG